MTQLIYYPFIALSLWLLSRNPAFDRWTVSVGTIAPAVIGAGVALSCALALQWVAESSRTHALEQLSNEIPRLSGGGANAGPSVKLDQLKQMQCRIEALTEGAFAPFWQQPLLKAMALPFVALGGTSLIDYLALANLS